MLVLPVKGQQMLLVLIVPYSLEFGFDGELLEGA
jgi:hypothetical protein